MNSEVSISENVLYNVWKNQNFNGSLHTADGNSIAVLDAGSLNNDEAGPDFRNARIRIGNLTFVGDVEIDRNYSDWKNHGHNIDNRYNSVVLHVFLFQSSDYGYVYARNGRKVPSVCIAQFIDQSIFQKSKYDEEEKQNPASKLKCTGLNLNIENNIKDQFLSNLGAVRFQKKARRVYDRLKEIRFLKELSVNEPLVTYDLPETFHEKELDHSDFQSPEIWMQLLYELVFEALGYSKNKLQMISLAQAADLDLFMKVAKDANLVETFETILLNISGLMQTTNSVRDEDSIEYVQRMEKLWNPIKNNYDGKYLDETIWHFFRLRPQNFPTVRIAGGARFLKAMLCDELINVMVKKISEIHNLKILVNSLRALFIIRADGYWKNHYVFDQKINTELKYFIGVARTDEIIVNVLLPFFAVYFEVFGKYKLVKKIQKIYSVFEQSTDNKIILEVADALKLNGSIKHTIISQGMIDLFRNYCSKNKCLECEIGKLVFN